jgi:hypothetical protein
LTAAHPLFPRRYLLYRLPSLRRIEPGGRVASLERNDARAAPNSHVPVGGRVVETEDWAGGGAGGWGEGGEDSSGGAEPSLIEGALL